MTIDDYYEHRRRELEENSVSVEELQVEISPDGKRGRLYGNLTLTTRAFLKVMERVAVQDDGGYEIVKYSYYVILDGKEVRGFDKDPTHDPPVHGHIGEKHKWTAAPEVSLEEALAHAWGEVQAWYDYAG